jgi:acyl-CoA reductase-like NAD-dependent aldehyde dehydrogenase
VTSTETEVLELHQFLRGEWTPAAGGETFDDYDPFTGDVVARGSAVGDEFTERRWVTVTSGSHPFPF